MKPPVTLESRFAFDTIIDARTPAEFAIDHIPGAINCPVLNDDERCIVGTLYKQQGAFEARRLGSALVAANLAVHIQTQFANHPASWRPLIYCWRGGLRSGSMAQWLRLVGWDAQQLPGGYKVWRRHVIATIERVAPLLHIVIVSGATGSAKTQVLHALAERGHQTIDLEGLARHKGSLLGAWPGVPQPFQIGFETALAAQLETLDLNRPVFVESEGARIGQINVPTPLVSRMRQSPQVIEVQATVQARVAYLLRDYAYLGERPEWLAKQLEPLTHLHGRETIAAWQAMALANNLPPLFEQLATRHYDPAYARSQQAHYVQWPKRVGLETDDLSEAGIGRLAEAVASAGASLG